MNSPYRGLVRVVVFIMFLIFQDASHATTLENSVVVWGDNRNGVESVPANITNVASLYPNAGSCVVIRNDGTVRSWGLLTNAPALTNASSFHSDATGVGLLRLNDGRVVNWLGTVLYSNAVAVSQAMSSRILDRDGREFAHPQGSVVRSNVAAILPGAFSTAAIFVDGRVSNDSGLDQLTASSLTNIVDLLDVGLYKVWLRDDGTIVSTITNLPSGLTNVVAIAGTTDYAMALKGDGTLAAFNNTGFVPNIPPLTNVVAIAAAGRRAVALKMDGTVEGWGVGLALNPPSGLTNVTAISASPTVSGAIIGPCAPSLLTQPANATVFAGHPAIFIAKAHGSFPLHYQWMWNGEIIEGATNFFYRIPNTTTGKAGAYTLTVSNAHGIFTSRQATLTVRANPAIVQHPKNSVVAMGRGARFAVEVEGDPVVYQWYFKGNPIPGATGSDLVLSNVNMDDSGFYSCVVENSHGTAESASAHLDIGALASWGNAGTYGSGPVAYLHSGLSHGFLIEPSGNPISWPAGEESPASIPVGVSNIVSFAAGQGHTLALRQDGVVIAWGDNTGGQCQVPVGLSNVVAIAAGRSNSFALAANGLVFAWGSTNFGLNTVPAHVTNVVSLAAKTDHCLALRSDGTVLAWGSDSSGQCEVPPHVTNAVAIAAAPWGSLALLADGTVASWGTLDDASTIETLADIVELDCGASHCIALRRNGTVIAWGNNSYGQTDIPFDLTNVVMIAATAFGSQAVVAENFSAPAFSLEPSSEKDATISIRIPTERGRSYRIEYSDAVTGQRLMMPPIPGDGSVKNVANLPSGAPQRFYRVRLSR